jgi:hypothetical protein
MARYIVVVAILAILVVIPAVGHAQTCFNGKSLPDCKRFLVTEFTYGQGVGLDAQVGHLFSLELGMMFNLSQKHAVGGSCYGDFLVDSDWVDEYRVGLKARYRYWLNPTISIDADVGGTITTPRLALIDLDAFYRNWIGIGGRVEFWPETTLRGSDTVFYGTLKIGGWPGLSVATIVAGVVAYLWVVVLSN